MGLLNYITYHHQINKVDGFVIVIENTLESLVSLFYAVHIPILYFNFLMLEKNRFGYDGE